MGIHESKPHKRTAKSRSWAPAQIAYAPMGAGAPFAAAHLAQSDRPSLKHPSQQPCAYAEGMAVPTAAAVAVGVLSFTVLLALIMFFAGIAPTASADEDATGTAQGEASTPIALWMQGETPHLYADDPAWASVPYGEGTIATAGSGPVALSMAEVALTGTRQATPDRLAELATDVATAGTDTASLKAFIEAAAAEEGLEAADVAATELDVRHALAEGNALIAIIPQASGGFGSTCMVVDGVNERSQLTVLDPMSAAHEPESWSFSDLTHDAAALIALSVPEGA